MTHNFLTITLSLTILLASGCAAPPSPVAWTTYHAASDTLVNPEFPPYSFDYPSDWQIEEGVNHITFVSEPALLKELPQRLEPGQIIAGLSINLSLAPGDMVETYTSSLAGMIEFQDPVAVRLNGHPAVYQEGVGRETGDTLFVLAVDMEHAAQTRGLLTARMARGELKKWEDVLFKMAGSLQVEE